MTLAWTAVSWARGSSTRWGSWGWSWHQRDQAAGASPPPLLGFRPPHGPRPHPGRRRAQERQQQARGGRKVHGEGRGPLLAPARGGGHGRGGGGGLYRKRSPFSDAANLYFRSSTSCTSVADFLVSYVASAGRAWALHWGHHLATSFRDLDAELAAMVACARDIYCRPHFFYCWGNKMRNCWKLIFFSLPHVYLGSWQILNFKEKI